MSEAKEEKKHHHDHEPEHTPADEVTTAPEAEGAAVKDETPEDKPEDNQPEQNAEKAPEEAVVAKKKFNLKEFVATKKGKIILGSAAAAILLIIVLFVVPVTRYGILGTVIKKDVELTLLDNVTSKPITDADITIAGQVATSDESGKVKVSGVPVGPQHVQIKKNYYKDTSVTVNVWLTKPAEPATVSMEATGRQVPVKVLNKISAQPVEKVVITAAESSAITDEKGEAVLVLPADGGDQQGSITADGYNSVAATVTLTDQNSVANVFTITPAGKIYFLSKRTGKINVMKSDLDGSNAQVVVEGTGKEDETNTLLVATRDWKFLALKAKRDSDKAKLYIIDTSKDSLAVMDEGNAEFTLYGWADHRFVYTVLRDGVGLWQPKREALKSFDADQSKLATLDETNAEGSSANDYVYERFASTTLIDNEVVYAKVWDSSYYSSWRLSGKTRVITTIQASGADKKGLKDFTDSPSNYIDMRLYAPDELYAYVTGSDSKVYEYEHGVFKETKVTPTEFYKSYPVYLKSPSNQETLWSESRDGKNIVFVGNAVGEESRAVIDSKDYRQYGWFTDEYLLLSKDGSELYVASKSHPEHVVKITDYHKPYYELSYGGGYGGY